MTDFPIRKWMRRAEDFILILLLLTMIVMAVLQIVLRNTMGFGIVWGDALVRILVLWTGLVGAMAATRQNNHININIVTRYLSSRTTLLVNALTLVFTAFICLLTAWYSLAFVRMEYEFSTPAFAGVPGWVCQSIIPVAFLVIALRCLDNAVTFFQRYRKP
ncbi:MAG: TRAP transporter small permease [Desulfobacteraceae bacterium]|nr:TRAP transporter small permease [Desulfobacteraceae bacterium]